MIKYTKGTWKKGDKVYHFYVTESMWPSYGIFTDTRWLCNSICGCCGTGGANDEKPYFPPKQLRCKKCQKAYKKRYK